MGCFCSNFVFDIIYLFNFLDSYIEYYFGFLYMFYCYGMVNLDMDGSYKYKCVLYFYRVVRDCMD